MKVEIIHCPTWHNNATQVASLAALIKKRLGIDPILTPGNTGQFDVLADGEKIAARGGNWLSRKFGAGYPDLVSIVDQLESAARTTG